MKNREKCVLNLFWIAANVENILSEAPAYNKPMHDI
jgi:hypothetical protein